MTQNKTTQAGERTREQEQNYGKPIETIIGSLLPSLTHDTAAGEKITGGYLAMGSEAATCHVTHEGKKHQLRIIQTLGGTIEVTSEFRSFELNLRKFVEHAIENGLLAPTIDFEKGSAKS